MRRAEFDGSPTSSYRLGIGAIDDIVAMIIIYTDLMHPKLVLIESIFISST